MGVSMQLEMMSDAIDETLDKDEAEEETEELTNQVTQSSQNTTLQRIFLWFPPDHGNFIHGKLAMLGTQVLDEIGVDVASQVCFPHMAVVCCADTERVLILTYRLLSAKCSFLRLLKGASEQLTRKSITAKHGMQMFFSTDNTMPFKFRSAHCLCKFGFWANCGFCSNAAAPARNVAAPPESSAEVDDLERRLASLRRIWVWTAEERTCL